MLWAVPLRSVLGPLLSLIIMTDIKRNTENANLGSFKDNIRTWHLLNITHAPKHLQTALDQICIWAEDNNMLFNGEKFELLNFGKSARKFNYGTPQGK